MKEAPFSVLDVMNFSRKFVITSLGRGVAQNINFNKSLQNKESHKESNFFSDAFDLALASRMENLVTLFLEYVFDDKVEKKPSEEQRLGIMKKSALSDNQEVKDFFQKEGVDLETVRKKWPLILEKKVLRSLMRFSNFL